MGVSRVLARVPPPANLPLQELVRGEWLLRIREICKSQCSASAATDCERRAFLIPLSSFPPLFSLKIVTVPETVGRGKGGKS